LQSVLYLRGGEEGGRWQMAQGSPWKTNVTELH